MAIAFDDSNDLLRGYRRRPDVWVGSDEWLPYGALTLFLVRHASAGVRNNRDANDAERCLDLVGQDQASAIGSELARHSISAIFSSPARRCIDTVGPLADQLGIEVTVAPQLFEGATTADSMAFIRSFTGEHVVACSHGDVIPDVLRNLEVGGTLLDGRGCAKGSIWELDNSSERIESGTYLGPVTKPV